MEIKNSFGEVKSYGCIGFEYIDIANSTRQFAILSKLSPWDHLPGILIIREANGFDTYFDYGIYNHCLNKKNLICVAPDVGGVERTRALARKLDIGIAIIDKRRPAPGKSQVMNVIGNVNGKTCIIIDDIIDSGGTIVNAAEALINRGAKEVHVYITHGVLSGESVDKIKKSRIKKLIITDTIDNSDKIKKAKNIEVLSISNLLAEAIKRISNSTSVSDLFK